MSEELFIYKQKRINQLNAIANKSINKLNTILVRNVRNVRVSRLRNKPALINNMIRQHIRKINNIKLNLTLAINATNSFKPNFIVEQTKIKNKKALLIGINYLNTPYQLNGCIDDTNRMKEFLTNYGFNDFTILTDLTSPKPTKQKI